MIAPSASHEEAAAIVAALERFMRATARSAIAVAESRDEWREAAILEGVEREGPGDVPDPWINT
jgi:predicted transcriptional regulator